MRGRFDNEKRQIAPQQDRRENGWGTCVSLRQTKRVTTGTSHHNKEEEEIKLAASAELTDSRFIADGDERRQAFKVNNTAELRTRLYTAIVSENADATAKP